MKQLVNSLAKYTGISAEQIELAMEAVQRDIKEDLEQEFADRVFVESDPEEKTSVAYGYDFLEWLFDNYTVEPR